MPFIDWEDGFSVHHDEMDKHHQKLIELINDIHTSILENRVQNEAQVVLNELYKYTKYHFAAEEKLIASHDPQAFPDHQKSHEYLTGRVKELCDKFYSDADFNVFELLGFLRTWLVQHIIQEDKPIFLRHHRNATSQHERDHPAPKRSGVPFS